MGLAVLDDFEDPVSLFSPDGTYVYINPAGEKLLGMQAGDLVGRTYLAIFPDLATHPYRAAFERVSSGASAVERLEFHYPPMNRWSSQRIYMTQGFVTVVWQDVTARKQAELALLESIALATDTERQFQTMVEGMPQLAWRAGPDGFIDYYNPRWYEYTGTSPADMEGWGWQSVHDPALLPTVMERWQHSISTGEPFEMEFPLRRHDGAMRWFLTRVTPARDETGRVLRWIGINTDIDEQKRALAVLDDTLESMSDAFFLLDKDWRVVQVNRNQERVSQTTRRDSLGKRFWDLFPATAAPDSRYWIEYHRAMKLRVDVHFEEYYAPLDVWTEVDAFPSREGGIAVFFRDISERKRSELLRAESFAREKAARAAAEAASSTKDEFLAMLGHELRNPLAPITTALELIRQRGGAAHQRELVVIERQTLHLVRLVDDLLDVSRITSRKIELDRLPVDLTASLANAIETASPLIEQRGHTLDLKVAPGLTVIGDVHRLEQVFSNLIVNAAKYTPARGHIEITAVREGESVAVRVKDSGIGIPSDLLPRVFDMFIQGRRSIERADGGLGLGLTIVRRLVELHGGEVSAHSDGAGSGSTFSVYLPVAPTVGDAAATAAPVPKLVSSPTRRRVLVVDDNEDAAMMLAALLESLGFEVQTAHDGPSALATLHSFEPEAAVLDIGLPVMDGYEVARRIRTHNTLGRIQIVALTGYGQADDHARTAAAGFDHHLTKPVNISRLVGLLGIAQPGD